MVGGTVVRSIGLGVALLTTCLLWALALTLLAPGLP